jgi:hypothetical protein
VIGVQIGAVGFSIEGADWRNVDLLSSPLAVSGTADVTGVVIRLTSKTTRVSGVVRESSGTAFASGSVIVFPASPETWTAIGFTARRFRSAPVDPNGAYAHTQLPPGDYFITFVSTADRAHWTDPKFLAAAAKTATRLRVEPGATIALDLRAVETGGRR